MGSKEESPGSDVNNVEKEKTTSCVLMVEEGGWRQWCDGGSVHVGVGHREQCQVTET